MGRIEIPSQTASHYRKLGGKPAELIAKYKYVANEIESSRRREYVAFGVHQEIAALPRPDLDAALERAESEGWTVREARKKLGKGSHVAENSGENEWYTPPALCLTPATLRRSSTDAVHSFAALPRELCRD